MEINENKKQESNSKIILTNRKHLSISGVCKFLGASDSLATMMIGKSKMQVEGKQLEIVKLDVESGYLELSGEVVSVCFDREEKRLFKRLFK